MLPTNPGGHSTYQTFVATNLPKYYPDPNSIPTSTWDIMERFWNLDLSFTDELLSNKYSPFGPKPRLPSSMQPSYLLSIDFKISSITDWVAQLKLNPIFAILSGFDFGDTPGVGTFYDFFKRLWDLDTPNISEHIHAPKKKKVKKPKQKGEKADSIEPTSVETLLQNLQQTSFSIEEQPYSSLFQIYRTEFLDVSIQKNLIEVDSLAISGDSTPVVTSHRERKHHICSCSDNGIFNCDCDRFFSQPDCDIGWDSSRNCFFHGFHLYMIVDAHSKSDLPIFPLFHPASKHDSHGFLETYFRMIHFLPNLHVNKWLLDSAHDAMPYYLYCLKNKIQPLIDLNAKRGAKQTYKDDFTLGEDGIPICKATLKMHRDGSEPSKNRKKFRCPLANRKHGCSCETPCSTSKYGRTVHTAIKDNPRLINFPGRDSEEWKKEYNNRTSSERSNKREKIDFQLENGRHRSTKMWYCRLYHIMMLQHLDAWDLPPKSKSLKMILQMA